MSSMSNKNATTLPGKKLSKQQKLPTNYSNKFLRQSSVASNFLSLETLPEVADSNFLRNSLTKHNFHETPRYSVISKGNEKLCRNSSATFNSENKNSDYEDESELIGMLTKQLYLATNQIQKMQSLFLKSEEKLKVKEQEINLLKRKNKELTVKHKFQDSHRKRDQQECQKQLAKSDNLVKKCHALETRILEMEKFLEDYGLVWIGGQGTNSSSETLSKDYIESCYTQLIANIEELNIDAGIDEVQVHHSQDGSIASFKVPKCMTLKFFKNGLVVEGGRLRLYSDPLTKCFIRDILDGYYPSEFQNNYPNGVPLKVEDHRKEIYIGYGADFPGHGYRLGKQVSSQYKTTMRDGKSANSWPGSTNQSPINTNRDLNLQSPLQDLSNKLTKSKKDSFTSSDLNNLRLQISASHNHNCSNTHLQSHINAELALSARKSKIVKTSMRNSDSYRSLNQSPIRFDKMVISKNVHQSSRNLTPVSNRKFRSRSASHSEKRFNSGTFPKNGSQYLTSSQNNLNKLQNKNLSTKIHTPRASKSATLNNSKELPFILQINDPSYNKEELRLKIRSLNGGKIYLIHISANETVARLYEILNTTAMKDRPASKKYHIVTNGYESKRLNQMNLLLKDYGITRDSVLHLVNGN
ncbi:uncharacterized protein LOC127281532 [Leptopilina boulardi]|uniref:uncharacterized protein LOC127281532 n=1 Tax=Leptopilina boulardi TaxID=63433 RepID=UPI0021F64E50|nr:uncharacterized protein LOC127281532 [Leptopilina boulardi]